MEAALPIDVQMPLPDRPPPPWLADPGATTVKRSTSHDQFLRPPLHCLRRGRPCTAPQSQTLWYEDSPLPLTSHKSHFPDPCGTGRRPLCRPESTKLAAELKYEAPFGLARTTSQDAFLSKPYMRRQPIKPPSAARPPFSSIDAAGFEPEGTTTAVHYQQKMYARRQLCRPPSTSSLPFASADVIGRPLPRTTSRDAFQVYDVRLTKRKPCTPVHSSKPPYY